VPSGLRSYYQRGADRRSFFPADASDWRSWAKGVRVDLARNPMRRSGRAQLPRLRQDTISAVGHIPSGSAAREISLAAIEEAARFIYDPVVRTPLVRLELPPTPGVTPDTEIFLKLETVQPVGSFKIRGAWNVIRQTPSGALADGVWTVSAGNAAQGVALAARTAGVRCSVMVTDSAPDIKIRAIQQLGATIVRAPYEECWRTVERHNSDRMRGLFIHPFDDDRFIAGNGTAGLEILEDVPDVDVVIAALGGGGLLAGVASAIRAKHPRVQVFAAEPETASPFETSLRNNRASTFDAWRPSFVDGAGGRSVLPTMWPLLSRLLSGSLVVTLDEVKAAIRTVADRCHVIAEGAAGCAVAAARSGRVRGKIVAIVSGGNIDLQTFAAIAGAGTKEL
jgi:threonine dehydratase